MTWKKRERERKRLTARRPHPNLPPRGLSLKSDNKGRWPRSNRGSMYASLCHPECSEGSLCSWSVCFSWNEILRLTPQNDSFEASPRSRGRDSAPDLKTIPSPAGRGLGRGQLSRHFRPPWTGYSQTQIYTTATAVTSINCSGRPSIRCMDIPVADGNRSPKYLRRTSPTFR